ncbi:hypothetical protein EVG20_g8256 [Dentipellis fragilis]|uniref:Uncharacterized protein n=1 Tax=Dentipellis fragilis TaxID=205917 RepID=A0A4Y9YBD2_9AGAM|nr:hypothetical protein EVG20_g8256 [Dentipellis fragilis]
MSTTPRAAGKPQSMLFERSEALENLKGASLGLRALRVLNPARPSEVDPRSQASGPDTDIRISIRSSSRRLRFDTADGKRIAAPAYP